MGTSYEIMDENTNIGNSSSLLENKKMDIISDIIDDKEFV